MNQLQGILFTIGMILLLAIYCWFLLIVSKKKERMYYIILLPPTSHYLYFWCQFSGYTNDIESAGKYTESQVKSNPAHYNNGMNSLAIPCDEIKNCFQTRTRFEYDREILHELAEGARKKHSKDVIHGLIKEINDM
ncbi:MAG: hypothetical protein PHT07_23965 [Paludibacter sp.]|nr:hypothetical protein [Paludibacter sp.]